MRSLRQWRTERAERRRHDDRDYHCFYWWGDRSPLDREARCPVCRPIEEELADDEDERPILSRLTPEQITDIRRWVRDYESRMEMIWQDLAGDIAALFDLTDEEAEEAMIDVHSQ